MTAHLVRGDARMLPLASGLQVDAIVTDPPAGIGFMGRLWDHNHGGRDGWVRAFAAIFTDCLAHLKPGGHAFVWALPRTSHWTATALEDAGFEIRDVVVHLFGSGFPKSLDVGKAIDKAAGAEREVVGADPEAGRRNKTTPRFNGTDYANGQVYQGDVLVPLTAPATEDAARWAGWGTAIKPASEHWILCRKPLSEPTVAANVLAHGVGCLNIAACRVESAPSKSDGWRPTSTGRTYADTSTTYSNGSGHGLASGEGTKAYNGDRHPAGRWPANVCLSHNDDCEQVGTKDIKGTAPIGRPSISAAYGDSIYRHGLGPRADVKTPTGTETVPAWCCTDDCAVALLDAQSGTLTSGAWNGVINQARTKQSKGAEAERIRDDRPADTGGASRFFYCAKASTSERSAGLAPGERSDHPTVKPIALMRWLCRLITPPGGTVLDCFMGSGTTGCAAVLEGFNFIGIEQDAHYVDLARRRITYWAAQGRQTDMFAEVGA